jgi:hypothetical protein
MRLFLVFAMSSLVLSCSKCGNNATVHEGAKRHVSASIDVPDVVQPGLVFRDALEHARQEIHADNAWDQLDEIERDVDHEAGAYSP